ncbi:CRISP-associated protein Cas1 [Selenomonas ruminantium]|uniref:CRISPR-associated endonuclease Cas1 n=1 Tax=Selenomonas ruminantium TaxID=971 RepID=A0A1M6ST74_SELRU|nr:type II CRISPR-associated endonuclease Cas1 [Selenomonas ruminantium]SHK47856.1 CRISP-associated protein Cas1 [Selenomonas ruminantium]
MYQQVIIDSRAKIYQRNHQLCVNTGEVYHIPIEDIDTIVIANRESSITVACLDSLVENGSSVLICGKNYMPEGILLPFGAYSRRLRMIKYQIGQGKPAVKQLWKMIVQRKIANQGRCLTLAGKQDCVSAMVDRVQSGDKGNVESIAAARYFKALFGSSFVRHDMDIVNSMLDYGYAILRSAIARYLAAYGFEPCLGIHHHSEVNAFNLADDLIEPFRPLVDLYASQKGGMEVGELPQSVRQELVGLLSVNVLMGKERVSVSNAVERVVQGLARWYQDAAEQLVLPQLLPLSLHNYE